MDDITYPDLPAEFQGVKMQALRDDRRRRFAYIMACGEASAAQAARSAGYSDASGSDKVTAHYLMQDQDVLAAIEEVGRKVLIGLAPVAIKRAKAILNDPDHKRHAHMIEVILDRTGFAAKTEHTVTVTHTADVKELEALARRLALENGIAPEKFVGLNGLGGSGDSRQKVIEHQEVASEVSRETSTEDGK